jgi:hypothetical protein
MGASVLRQVRRWAPYSLKLNLNTAHAALQSSISMQTQYALADQYVPPATEGFLWPIEVLQ